MKYHTTIKPARLEFVVQNMIKEFGDDVRLAVRVAVDETAQEVTDQLRHAGDFKGKKYRASWTYTVKQTTMFTDATVFNKRHYRLTHLLEFGHDVYNRKNGPKLGEADAHEHIYPINQDTGEIFERKLRDILGYMPR